MELPQIDTVARHGLRWRMRKNACCVPVKPNQERGSRPASMAENQHLQRQTHACFVQHVHRRTLGRPRLRVSG